MAELPSPTIHRKTISIVDRHVLTVPRGAVILHVSAGYLGAGADHPVVEVWYHCDLDQYDQRRTIRVIEHGKLADVDPAQYLGTVVHGSGRDREVRHVFDEGPAGAGRWPTVPGENGEPVQVPR